MSDSNAANRAMVTKVLFGVTSVGAALGLLYMYYSRLKKKDAKDSTGGDSVGATKNNIKRRVTTGEKNRVTFSDQHEIIGTASVKDHDDDEYDADEEEVAVAKSAVEENGRLLIKRLEFENNQDVSDDESSTDSLLMLDDSHGDVESASEIVEKIQSAEMKLTMSESDVKNTKIKKEDDKLREQEQLQEDSCSKIDGGAKTNGVYNSVETSQQRSPNVAASNKSIPEPEHPPKSAITPETDYDNASKIMHMMIPRDLVPGLIGKKGARIKNIQSASNTVINFQDETLENGDRVCVIRGLPQDVTLAESMIEKFVMEQPVVSTHTISVPQSCVGRIIGKGGESIRQIQDMSRAKVTVDSQNTFQRGGADSGSHRNVIIKGTEEQIETARQLILAKVEEEQTLRRNIDIATQNRTPRRPNGPGPSSVPAAAGQGAPNVDLAALNGNSVSLCGELEVFVSCAYHPNDFFIQVMGRESIDLDKLTESMTDWYTQLQLAGASLSNPDETEFSLGEIIAAPFDVDSKMYRGKIIKIDNASYEVMYVDYGDKRTLRKEELHKIHPEFLKLRFQAIQATLNLGCIGERWMDDTINDFCDLTYCAQWQSLRAKVKDYLKDPNDHRDTIWIELIDKDLNIGDELVRRGLAVALSDSPNASGAVNATSSSRKSYAAVVADENKTTSHYDNSSADTWENNTYNGN